MRVTFANGEVRNMTPWQQIPGRRISEVTITNLDYWEVLNRFDRSKIPFVFNALFNHFKVPTKY